MTERILTIPPTTTFWCMSNAVSVGEDRALCLSEQFEKRCNCHAQSIALVDLDTNFLRRIVCLKCRTAWEYVDAG